MNKLPTTFQNPSSTSSREKKRQFSAVPKGILNLQMNNNSRGAPSKFSSKKVNFSSAE
jgi:hypothetical protein